jgi:hypothetical protein
VVCELCICFVSLDNQTFSVKQTETTFGEFDKKTLLFFDKKSKYDESGRKQHVQSVGCCHDDIWESSKVYE